MTQPSAARKIAARDVMHADPVTVRPETPLKDAIMLLMEHHISGLPVVDAGHHLVGMITEKDMLRLVYDDLHEFTLVGDLMITNLRAFQADEELAVVCDCLMANHFRRVPILEGERLVGLISRADLMGTILELASEKVTRN